MGKFVPESFKLRDQDVEWAIKEFRIEKKEVLRQLELMRDHEFRRSYTDWNRVFRNWMRKAEVIESLQRGRRKPDEYTEEQRQVDARKAWAELNRLKAVK